MNDSKKIPLNLMRQFQSDIGVSEFFSYTGNMVTIEQALAVIGVLQPDFVERDGCVFWCSNEQEYDPEKYPKQGFKADEQGKLITCNERASVERYRNNFSVNQFFSKWEGSEKGLVFKVGLGRDDYILCCSFAEQIVKYWKSELGSKFPDRAFSFEIGDNLLDEYGVCITFWQN